MKVLYDHQTFSLQNYGGISRYFCEFVQKLKQTQINDTFTFGLLFSNNIYIQNTGLSECRPFFKNYKYRGQYYLKSIIYRINSLYASYIIKNFDIDILHATYYDVYFQKLYSRKKMRLVITFHDMTNEALKDEFPELNHQITIDNKRKAFDLADKVIAISEHTKNDIIKYYKVPDDKIVVIYHGFTSFIENARNSFILKKADLPEKYLLFVGQRVIYKNFNRFFKAIIPILKKNPYLSLICAGGGCFTKEELNLICENQLNEQVKFIDIYNDGILNQLYSNALAFLFPSLYEGFGLPILEAFYCKCPVILANTSCFPEIAADAALYFNPRSEESIRNAINNFLVTPEIREHLISKGLSRLSQFTWGKTAQKTYEVYKSLL
jgi:glycosyltransferase involved in cell wall biosynthesis